MRADQLVRIIVHDHADAFVCDLDPAKVASAVLVEEVNGEHSLTITTEQELGKGDRLIVRDGMGTWHEYVVLGIESRHVEGGLVLHEHYCVWSIQHDLSATYIDDQFGCGVVPGHASVPQPARRALECALEGTNRWSIGTISVTAQSSASFYRRSGWDGLKTVLERWGGELQATITVSTTGVVGRAVDLLEHVGASTATRRFDYGADLTGIKRTLADEVWPCRIVPLGKSSETEAGGYTRRPGIASVNGGIPWVQNDSMVAATRLPDGSGGWEYPTSIITNDTYEDPADLKAWALEHIGDYTTPTVTYEASVAQFAEAGLDPHGVALGDAVAIVDRTFGEGGLRLMARVTKIRRDLCDPAKAELTIGNADTSLAAQLGDISRTLAELGSQVASGSEYQSSSAYMDAIIGRLNDEINATGGYWYIVPGLGTRTYDVPVSDPAVGAEASQVVEVRGGTIRIANTKDQAGNWEWRTVVESGEVIADNVRALNVNAGLIQSYDGSSFWDLDTGVFERALIMAPKLTSSSTIAFGSWRGTSANLSITAGRSYIVVYETSNTGREPRVVAVQDAYTFVPLTALQQSSVVRTSGGTATCVALLYAPVTGSDNVMFKANPSTTGTDSVTNVRVYEVPDEGDGVIGFRLKSEDGRDEFLTQLAGGHIRLSALGDLTEIRPGFIEMSTAGTSTGVAMRTYSDGAAGMFYDQGADTLRFGNQGPSASGLWYDRTADRFTLNGPLAASNFGTVYATQAEIFSSVGQYATISNCYAVKWGPMCLLSVSVQFSTTSVSSMTIGTLVTALRPVLNPSYRYAFLYGSGDGNSAGHVDYRVDRYGSLKVVGITGTASTSLTYRLYSVYMCES